MNTDRPQAARNDSARPISNLFGDIVGGTIVPLFPSTEARTANGNGFDVAAAVRFLQTLDADGRHNICHCGQEGESWAGRTFPANDWTTIADYLRQIPAGRNVYYSINEPMPDAADKKLGKSDIARIRAIGLDLDLDTGRPLDAAQADVEQRAQAVLAGDVRPSLMVHSGGGRQALWLLSDKLDASEAQLAAEALGRAVAHPFGGDRSTFNIDRVFALPGTTKHPNAKKRAYGREAAPVRVLHADGPRVEIASIARAFPITVRNPVDETPFDDRRQAQAALIEAYRRTALRRDAGDPDQLGQFADLDSRFAAARADSRRLDALWRLDPAEANLQDRSGSGWLNALAYRLAAAGEFDGVDFARLAVDWNNPTVDPEKYDPDEYEGMRQLARAWLSGGTTGAAERERIADPSRWLDEPSEPAAVSVADRNNRLVWTTFEQAADQALSDSARPLIKGLLDQGAMTVLYGDSNVGKTFVALDMAYHVARGLAWGGMPTVRFPVVYIAAEGGSAVRKRAAALRLRHGEAGDDFRFILQPLDLLRPNADVPKLLDLLRGLPRSPGLIVVDTFSRALAGGDENSSTDMGAMVRHLDALRTATGAHVLVVHHSGKDASKGSRGHSLLRAATDTEIEIAAGRIRVTKQRDLPCDWSAAFSLDVVPIGKDSDGETLASCVVRLLDGAPVHLTDDQLERLGDEIGGGDWGIRDSGRSSAATVWVGVPIARALDMDLSRDSDKRRVRVLQQDLERAGRLVRVNRPSRQTRIVWRDALTAAQAWLESPTLADDGLAPPDQVRRAVGGANSGGNT